MYATREEQRRCNLRWQRRTLSYGYVTCRLHGTHLVQVRLMPVTFLPSTVGQRVGPSQSVHYQRDKRHRRALGRLSGGISPVLSGL
jgi:hypothetical protein